AGASTTRSSSIICWRRPRSTSRAKSLRPGGATSARGKLRSVGTTRIAGAEGEWCPPGSQKAQTNMRAELTFSFAKRELLGGYKGSALGIAWAVLTPVVMIAIFTFIFAGIFGARFGVNQSHWDYALYLFCGLLPWSMFQESVQQSANTILA